MRARFNQACRATTGQVASDEPRPISTDGRGWIEFPGQGCWLRCGGRREASARKISSPSLPPRDCRASRPPAGRPAFRDARAVLLVATQGPAGEALMLRAIKPNTGQGEIPNVAGQGRRPQQAGLVKDQRIIKKTAFGSRRSEIVGRRRSRKAAWRGHEDRAACRGRAFPAW